MGACVGQTTDEINQPHRARARGANPEFTPLTATPRAGAPPRFFEALPLIHDARLALEGGPCAARRAGEAAAAAAPAQQGAGLTLHQHAFHCAVLPPAGAAKAKPAKGR